MIGSGYVLGELAATLVALVVLVVAVAVFAAVIHWSWVAKEWLLARLAARVKVPYVTREPWHVRAWKWWLR